MFTFKINNLVVYLIEFGCGWGRWWCFVRRNTTKQTHFSDWLSNINSNIANELWADIERRTHIKPINVYINSILLKLPNGNECSFNWEQDRAGFVVNAMWINFSLWMASKHSECERERDGECIDA